MNNDTTELFSTGTNVNLLLGRFRVIWYVLTGSWESEEIPLTPLSAPSF